MDVGSEHGDPFPLGSQLSAISTVWELMFCIVPIAITPTPASESTRTDSTVSSLKTIDNFDITHESR